VSRLSWVLSRIRRTLWVRVSLYAALGVFAALIASLSGQLLPGSAPLDISTDAIESLLTIIASSMLAVTTFSVGALTTAYAGATTNATPRATPLLTEDEVVQQTLSTFVGSFLFSIVGLIALKVSFYGSYGRAVLFIGTLLVILMIVIALLRWINRLTKLGRVADTNARIENATDEAMKARIAAPFLGGGVLLPSESGAPLTSVCVGYVQFINIKALSEISKKLDVDIDVHVLPGNFVFHGSLLVRIVQDAAAITDETARCIREVFTIAPLRTFDEDPRFGLVVLSEVALRALSPAVNDPGTAIDVISRQTRLLSFWGDAWQRAKTTAPEYPRIRVAALQYDDMFEDAFNLVGRDAAGQIDVLLRLVKSLQALTTIGPSASRTAAQHQLDVILARAADKLQSPDDHRRLQAAMGLPGTGGAA